MERFGGHILRDFTTLAGTLVLTSCSQPAPWEPLDSASEQSIDCSEALDLAPAASVAGALSLVQLTASGGSGDYRFAITDDRSGGTVNERTGAYLSGETADVTDLVEVTDAACGGLASASIDVVPALLVAPGAAALPPGAALAIQISGGSGDWGCELIQDASKAALDDACAYTAGAGEGVDRVRVTDAVLGDSVDIEIDVAAANALQVDGWGYTFLIAGSPWAPRVQGGSGEIEIEILEGDLSLVEDGGALWVLGEEEGEGAIRISDALAPSLQVEIPVQVIAPRGPDLERDGERSGEGAVAALGDVNGDGWPDAALGFIEPSVGAYYSGLVAVYAGDGDGLAAEPVQTFSGDTPQQTMGRDVAAADVDNDGLIDLVIGADKTDRGATNNGAVFIHYGRDEADGGWFQEEPGRSLYGTNPYGRLGSALAICDFDGDGWLDLAVGALEDADQAVADPADEQGAVHIFRGGEGGYGDEADFALYGQLHEDGAWQPAAGIQMGAALAAGDLNGDGLCDLVAGAPDADADGDGSGDDGAAFVYLGSTDDGETLTREPAVAIVGDDDGELGRRLAVGDLDGDGRDDLAVAEWQGDSDDSGAGWVYVFFGAELDLSAGADLVDADGADWKVGGTSSYERVGSALDIADLEEDGESDLIIGVYRGELGTGVNEGVVRIYDGETITDAPDGSDASGTTPDVEIEGPAAYARLGQAVGAIGDADGDGDGDLLALAGYDSSWGIEAGAAYFLSGDDGATPVALDLPGEAAGHGIGQGLALADADGDGYDDLLVGAPGAGDDDIGGNAGAVRWYNNSYDTLAANDGGLWGGHDTHGAGDRFGYRVASIGDFDDDGHDDVAVISRKESRPSEFDEDTFDNPDDCPGAVNDGGAVLIYRGGSGGLDDEPAFAWYGTDSYDYLYEVQGGFDRDGDGHDDLAVSSYAWGDAGGFAVLYGRSASSKTTVLCDPEQYAGFNDYDRLGHSLAALGDLDGDGCDEFAVGASGEEFLSDYYNQGVVRVMWGYGSGCADEPRLTTMALNVVGAEAGGSLAGGRDVDGDGLPDLVVGGTAYREFFAEIGAAWFVPGWHILEIEPETIEAGELPDHDEGEVSLMLPRDGLEGAYGIRGRVAGGLFGDAVALIEDPTDSARAAIAIGAPQGDVGGTSLAGGVEIYRFQDDDGDGTWGLDAAPWGLVSGETASPDGGFGDVVIGVDWRGDPALLIGAPSSDEIGLDQGAVYIARF